MIEPSQQSIQSSLPMMQFNAPITSKSDIYSIVKSHLRTLLSEMKLASATTADRITKAHWADLADRIDNALNKKSGL